MRMSAPETSHFCILASTRVSCSEVIPSPGYSKEWRRWCSSFVRGVKLLDFPLFTVKYRWVAARHIHRHWWIKQFPSALLQLTIHCWSFTRSFWLQAARMLKCLCRTRFKSSLPSQHNQSSWEFKSHNPYFITFSPSVHLIPKLYLHSPPQLT